MAIDISGLLTGVLSPQQRAERRFGENLNQAALGPQGSTLLSTLGLADNLSSSLGRALGIDTRQPEQRVMDKIMPLLQSGDPKQVAQAVPILQNAGMSDLALQLQGRVNQELERQTAQGAEEKRRDQLIQAQSDYLSNAFPDKMNVLEPLLRAGIPLNTLVDIGRGTRPVPLNQAELTRLYVDAGMPLQEAARRAALDWNAREEQDESRVYNPSLVDSGDREAMTEVMAGNPEIKDYLGIGTFDNREEGAPAPAVFREEALRIAFEEGISLSEAANKAYENFKNPQTTAQPQQPTQDLGAVGTVRPTGR